MRGSRKTEDTEIRSLPAFGLWREEGGEAKEQMTNAKIQMPKNKAPNGQRFVSFPRKRESRKSAMVDSRLRGSDIVVRPMNYPKAKRSGKLLIADSHSVWHLKFGIGY